MAALLSENCCQDNGSLRGIHLALYPWREQLPATPVRMLAYPGRVTPPSTAAAPTFQSRSAVDPIKPVDHPQWIEIENAIPSLRARHSSVVEGGGESRHAGRGFSADWNSHSMRLLRRRNASARLPHNHD